jgi:hypothetical protein
MMGGKDCCGVEPSSPLYMMLEMCQAATPLKIIFRQVIGIVPFLPNSLYNCTIIIVIDCQL